MDFIMSFKRYILLLALCLCAGACTALHTDPELSQCPEEGTVSFALGLRGSAVQTKALDFEVGTDEENVIKHCWLLLYRMPSDPADRYDLSKYPSTPAVIHFTPGGSGGTTLGKIMVANADLTSAFSQTYPSPQNRETVYKTGNVVLASGQYWAAFVANTKVPSSSYNDNYYSSYTSGRSWDLVQQYLQNSSTDKSITGFINWMSKNTAQMYRNGYHIPVTFREHSVYPSDEGMYASRIFDEYNPLVVDASNASAPTTPDVIELYRRVSRLRLRVANHAANAEVPALAPYVRLLDARLKNAHFGTYSQNDSDGNPITFTDNPLPLDGFRRPEAAAQTSTVNLNTVDIGQWYRKSVMFSNVERNNIYPGMAKFYQATTGIFSTATGTAAQPYEEVFDIYIPSDPVYFARTASTQMELQLTFQVADDYYRYTVPIGTGSGVTAADLSSYWCLGYGNGSTQVANPDARNFNQYSILRNFIYEVNAMVAPDGGLSFNLKIAPWNLVEAESPVSTNFDPLWYVEAVDWTEEDRSLLAPAWDIRFHVAPSVRRLLPHALEYTSSGFSNFMYPGPPTQAALVADDANSFHPDDILTAVVYDDTKTYNLSRRAPDEAWLPAPVASPTSTPLLALNDNPLGKETIPYSSSAYDEPLRGEIRYDGSLVSPVRYYNGYPLYTGAATWAPGESPRIDLSIPATVIQFATNTSLPSNLLIADIRLKDIKLQDTYYFGTASSNYWEDMDGNVPEVEYSCVDPRTEENGGVYHVYPEHFYTRGTKSPGIIVLGGDKAFYVVPQSFAANSKARIEVTLLYDIISSGVLNQTDSSGDAYTEYNNAEKVVLYLPLAGEEWKSGQVITYLINWDENALPGTGTASE